MNLIYSITLIFDKYDKRAFNSIIILIIEKFLIIEK
jgi:hypothetical protein